MPITDREMENVKGILLHGAKLHFPPAVQFLDAHVTVRLDAHDEEYIDVELLYTAPQAVLDGHLMSTLFRVIDGPIRASGITARTLVAYTDVNDPTGWSGHKSSTPPSPVS